MLIIIIILLIILCIVSFFEYRKLKKCNMSKIINTLMRQCSRWAIASTQDKNPMISLLHANYAAGYLWALKDIADDIQIKRASNIDISYFTNKITNIQDQSTQKVSKYCPQFLKYLDKDLSFISGNL